MNERLQGARQATKSSSAWARVATVARRLVGAEIYEDVVIAHGAGNRRPKAGGRQEKQRWLRDINIFITVSALLMSFTYAHSYMCSCLWEATPKEVEYFNVSVMLFVVGRRGGAGRERGRTDTMLKDEMFLFFARNIWCWCRCCVRFL